jgi:predicted outer membrane repeat protein
MLTQVTGVQTAVGLTHNSHCLHSNDFFGNVAQAEDNRAPRYGGAIAAEGNSRVTICGYGRRTEINGV